MSDVSIADSLRATSGGRVPGSLPEVAYRLHHCDAASSAPPTVS